MRKAIRLLVVVTAIEVLVLALASGGSGNSAQVPACSTATALSFKITGIWSANDGGTYWLRQVGNCVWWTGFSGPLDSPTMGKSFSNALFGTIVPISGKWYIYGQWADVPRGGILGTGILKIWIRTTGKLQKVASSGSGFGATLWTRVG